MLSFVDKLDRTLRTLGASENTDEINSQYYHRMTHEAVNMQDATPKDVDEEAKTKFLYNMNFRILSRGD